MKVITRDFVISTVAERWKGQYLFKTGWTMTALANSGDVYAAIIAAEKDREKIDAAIGNGTWTELKCDECRQDVDTCAQFDIGGEYVHNLCVNCLTLAMDTIYRGA